MTKHVLAVGNCGFDQSTLQQMLTRHFDVKLSAAVDWSETEQLLKTNDYHLVLVNRKLDLDHSDGLQIIKRILADEQTAEIPVMMITNYSEHQQRAVQAGALPGFGKSELNAAETLEKLRPILAE